MSDRFEICHSITAKWEGGWSDHKLDPGGKTMYGITEAVYHAWLKVRGLPLKPVRNISKTEALSIYREQYWKPTAEKFNLFPGVDLAVYDASVNSGVSRGVKWLKASVGSINHAETVKKICRARLSFMQGLEIWKTFGRGWGRRVADIEAKGVKMALEAMQLSPRGIELAVNHETEEAKKTAAKNDKAAKTAAGGAGASAGGPVVTKPEAAVDPSQIDATTLWIFGALAAACLIAALIFYARKKAAKAREDAYREIMA